MLTSIRDPPTFNTRLFNPQTASAVSAPIQGSYPGFGLPLRELPQEFGDIYPTGHDEECLADTAPLLHVREVAMMHVMDRLTDKPDWDKKVFDDEIVAHWRAEAIAYPDDALWKLAATDAAGSDSRFKGVMTEKMFDYCIEELRGKVKHFADTGIVPTLDSEIATAAKSDELVQPELTKMLRESFDRLKKDQSNAPDWHPGTDEKVLNLVHPSMYPLVYKSTKVFRDEVVGVADAIDRWAGKGTIICNDEAGSEASAHVPAECWSENYQWLPSNVALRDDGSVKFTSYINNLHPTKYPEIYSAIEQLVRKALPMWDQCLWTQSDYEENNRPGRLTSRFSLPDWPSDENMELWTPSSWEALRPTTPNLDEDTKTEEERRKAEWTLNSKLKEMWLQTRQPIIPEPNPFEEVDYHPRSRLVEKFKDTGLQIIVKMVSIELTPEKPTYPHGSWHIEGQINEHICGTALYYVDSENVTTSHLSFRMHTDVDLQEKGLWDIGQYEYHWLEIVHGTRLGMSHGAGGQHFGNIETPQGRLLAFPNSLQHAVSPFELVDKTKPGHRRFIALWLVDPNIRVISTANVPPQQQDWWIESAFGRTPMSQQAALAKLPAELVQMMEERGLIEKTQLAAMQGRLPVELVDVVRRYFDESSLLMSAEDARAHRLKLMEERTYFMDSANWMLSRSYGFCEH
ncbi:hypothetical protein RRF57_001671 [Xylaria bambusicola]|uniref:Uncharacterized protein n=1 Tax=Xylaria bambusicola TaxID=326684 RepID=A0AAN7YV32_9PEZI